MLGKRGSWEWGRHVRLLGHGRGFGFYFSRLGSHWRYV